MTPGQALLLIIWGVLAVIAGAIIGSRKGRPALGWILAILLGWIGVIIIACIPATHEKRVQREAERLQVQREAQERMQP